MKHPKRLIQLLLALCALGGAAHAQADVIIYDNGAPNHVSGNNMGFAYQAEDFHLSAATTLTDIHFWSLEADGAYRGSISWSILCDCGGAPGSNVLASGTQSMVTRSSTGSYLGLNEYSNSFLLNAPLNISAGNYWLVLHNGAMSNLGDPNEFLWETTNNNATVRGMESFAIGGAWTTNAQEHAFQISAVPEPAHALMLLAGLVVATGIGRRQRATEQFS